MKNAVLARPGLVLPACVLALACSVAQGQAANERADPSRAQQTRPELGWGAATQKITRDRLASRLIGTRVRNWQGEDLGEIWELVIDVNNGRVHYAVLSFEGGLLNLGGKLFAYPVTLLRQGTGDELILNVPREALERAPGFESSRWPDWNDRAYRETLERHHGPTVAVQPGANQRLLRASEVIGTEIEDARGRPVGEIRDVVADLARGEVRYVVLDPAPSWGPDDKLLALPLQSFGFPARGDDAAVLQTPRERIDMSRAFDAQRWPDFEDKAYRSGTDGIPGGAPPKGAGRQ